MFAETSFFESIFSLENRFLGFKTVTIGFTVKFYVIFYAIRLIPSDLTSNFTSNASLTFILAQR